MYKIAELNVAIKGEQALLSQSAAAYRMEECSDPVDIDIDITDESLKKTQKMYPHLSMEQSAYIYARDEFHHCLMDYRSFRLHASAVVLDGWAYLFSAPSGTGKSTHTSFWCEYFGSDRAYVLSDDSPAIKWIGDQFIAYSTPWSGIAPWIKNASAPVKGIAFIERSQTDWIRLSTHEESIILLMEQVSTTRQQKRMEKLLNMLDALMQAVPIYRMGCTVSRHSVETAYTAMSR